MSAAPITQEAAREMLAGHTPGPWTVQHGSVRAGDQQIAQCWRHLDGGFMCPDFTEAQANAHLIASAPDMLAALKGAAEWLSGWASAEPYLSRIEAAIQRAEGRS